MKNTMPKRIHNILDSLRAKENVADWICVFLLALCPILQNYRGLLVDARATVFVICLPYVLYKFWKVNYVNCVLTLPLLCFGLCKIFDNGIGFVELGREGLMCILLLAAASGVIDPQKFFTAILLIASLASVLIVLQYICYYIFDFHLQLVPTSLLLDNAEQWVKMAQTGRYSITGKMMSFYRPSSFFLEPSHMAIYCAPSIAFLLISPNMSKIRYFFAALITVGIMASTSGMGIMLALGLWMIFFVFYFGENGSPEEISFGKFKIKSIRIKDIHFKGKRVGRFTIKPFVIKGITLRPLNILLIVGALLLVIVLYCTVGFFRSSINRVLFSNGGYNAIAGRTQTGAKAVSKLRGLEILFGKRNPGSMSSVYMSAFHSTIFDYGVIGLIFSYIFYTVSLFTLKRQYFWITLMILGLSFFSVHTHGSAYMLFFCTILFGGHLSSGFYRKFDPSIRIHPFSIISKCKLFKMKKRGFE